jgi:hypothetical protein
MKPNNSKISGSIRNGQYLSIRGASAGAGWYRTALFMLGVITVIASLGLPTVCSAAGSIVLASSAGAHLNADLQKGGGDDDTQVLQRLLDGAANGRPVQLVIDGAALVSGLNVYGNTTIECTAGGGLYLKDGSSRAILRNAHRSRGARRCAIYWPAL